MKVRQTDWQLDRQSFRQDWKQRREERLNISDLMHYLYLRQIGWICQGALEWMEIFRFSATCVFLWLRKSEWVWMCVCACVCDWSNSGWKTKIKEAASGLWLCDPSVGGATLKLLLLSGRRPRWPLIACTLTGTCPRTADEQLLSIVHHWQSNKIEHNFYATRESCPRSTRITSTLVIEYILVLLFSP